MPETAITTGTKFADLPAEKRVEILERRLARARAALHEAETALEGRMRELDTANRELTMREADLAAKLDLESNKLLSAQKSGGFATIYADHGSVYQSSLQLNDILGLSRAIKLTPDIVVGCIHPLDRKRILADAQRFFAVLPAYIDHRFEHRIVKPDGVIRWLRWSLQKNTDESGAFRSVFGSVHDITDSRANQRAVRALQLRAERRVKELALITAKLERSQTQTQQALDARTQFLSYMAHQFRTPLNTFSGMVDLLSIDGQSPEDEERIMFAQRAAERLESLITEVIAEADGETNTPSLFPVRANLTALIEQTADYWNRSSEDSDDGGMLSVTARNTLPAAVSVDAARLREAIDSCVGYGLSSAGDVHLLAEWNDALCMTMEAARLAPDLDTAGPENLLSSDPQLRRARVIIEAMGGSLNANQGAQATLQLMIPMPLDHSALAHADQFLRNSQGDEPALLIAEDTESNRHVLVGLCKRLGCKVQTAVNGAEAVAAASEQKFDVILMDVQMPVMSGEEAVRHIRSGGSDNAATPVIGVTAHSLQAERARLLASGMSTCLAKPIQPAELRAALMTAMQARSDSGAMDNLFDLRRFREAFGALPDQFHEKFLGAIRDDLTTYGAALDQAIQTGDDGGADRQAHALKGIAGNIGAIALTEAIADYREAQPAQRAAASARLTEKIAATLEACGDLYKAMIEKG
ncbi:response regulator [Pontixanthobacter sp.]|uniref:response regulator n=1 Tax=Pontixanthobacter sp. TaxID=2792078 RepID=UPI003C7B221E